MSAKAPVELFMTDTCPYAQRAWIAFLEKEADPEQPQLFNYREINFFNPDLPETQRFLKLHKTVPAGYAADGEELRESMPMIRWVDAQWPQQSPLTPPTAEGRERMEQLITKFTSGDFDVSMAMFLLLTEQDAEKQKAHSEKLLSVIAELSREIQAGGGPYIVGSQFTLADVALIPFIERVLVVCAHFRGFAVPQTEQYAAFNAWVAAYSKRPSVRISSADRLPRSMAVQPFGAQERKAYLVESHQSFVYGVREQARRQLRHAPPGVSTVDIQKARTEKAAEEAAAKSQAPAN